MKHILFIGDLRNVYNYGAVATTEALLSLLEKENYNAEYRYIDFRSLYHPTPADGFPNKKESSVVKKCVKRIIKTIIPVTTRWYIKKVIYSRSSRCHIEEDFVPYKFSQFEAYFDCLQNGESLQYEKKLLDWADIVYINGEGNVVNGTDCYGKYRMGARYLLFMAWVAKIKYKLPTLIVNHTVDPNNYNAFEMISSIYPLLDEVLVRDTLSLPLLEAHGVTNAQFVPDALFSYRPDKDWQPSAELQKQIDFSKPFICLGDSSGIQNKYTHVTWDIVAVFTHIIEALREITPQIIFIDGYNGGNLDIIKVIEKNNIGYVNFNNCSYPDLYQVLCRANLFISGRWHASILSVLAGTPILLWGADSHKTRSLYSLLDYPYRFFEVSSLPVNIPELLQEARKILANSDTIKMKMASMTVQYFKETHKNVQVLRHYIDAE